MTQREAAQAIAEIAKDLGPNGPKLVEVETAGDDTPPLTFEAVPVGADPGYEEGTYADLSLEIPDFLDTDASDHLHGEVVHVTATKDRPRGDFVSTTAYRTSPKPEYEQELGTVVGFEVVDEPGR